MNPRQPSSGTLTRNQSLVLACLRREGRAMTAPRPMGPDSAYPTAVASIRRSGQDGRAEACLPRDLAR